MKHQEILKATLLSIAIVVAGYFIGHTHKLAKQYDRSVQVKGLSEKEVKADLAVWPVNITLTGNDLMELKRRIEQQNKAVYDFFVDQGFTAGELTLGSVNINDAQANVYNSPNNRTYRYIAKSDITIRTKDLEKLQKALSESLRLISKGILIGSKNQWKPIEYIFTGLNQIKPLMIEEATKNAREVAEKFAKDSNSKVGKIKNARQGLFTITDRDMNTPEIKVVRVVSTIEYLLED
ncbi:SIMPL domain-containing protein [Ancylomarina longa]|uniref:SIMPL domain-containing protein n=1 Tax=Ancylomarina longa TaxID=2487017 RepID=A0A434AFV9_9BACT|nr:SIMPL domain-containing protein [Ancylomarina longa]RUT73271.1 SIMPL domain-containing protein [Ancylomarina longa]